MAPYKYMKFKHVVLLALVTFALSIAAMPIYNAGVAAWDRHQLYEEMRTNPAYDIIDRVELEFAYITILTVVSSPQSTQVWMAFNIDVTEEEALTAIAYIAVTAAEYYTSERYFVIPVLVSKLRTVDGSITYIYSQQAFGLDREAIAVLNEQACSACVLGGLFATGHVQVVTLQSAPCPPLLRREPGYTWPWE